MTIDPYLKDRIRISIGEHPLCPVLSGTVVRDARLPDIIVRSWPDET